MVACVLVAYMDDTRFQSLDPFRHLPRGPFVALPCVDRSTSVSSNTVVALSSCAFPGCVDDFIGFFDGHDAARTQAFIDSAPETNAFFVRKVVVIIVYRRSKREHIPGGY
jgi:hypothetical protein